MKQIYTRTGDEGKTSLRGGIRVPKDDPRIEANGQIDQLNSLLGIIRTMLAEGDGHRDMIHDIQRELMTVMSHIATPPDEDNPRELHAEELTSRMEKAIDNIDYRGGFVIPGGGSTLAATIHLARTQVRTVERRLWSLQAKYPVAGSILVMMNRLSDYLFALANEKE